MIQSTKIQARPHWGEIGNFLLMVAKCLRGGQPGPTLCASLQVPVFPKGSPSIRAVWCPGL